MTPFHFILCLNFTPLFYIYHIEQVVKTPPVFYHNPNLAFNLRQNENDLECVHLY